VEIILGEVGVMILKLLLE
jgi:hypothetical protein